MSDENVATEFVEEPVVAGEDSADISEAQNAADESEVRDAQMEEDDVTLDDPQYTMESPRRSSRVVPVKKETAVDDAAPKRGGKRGTASVRKSSTTPSKKARKQSGGAVPSVEVIPPTAAINWVACGIPSCGKWRIVTPEQFVQYSLPKAKVTCSLIGTSCDAEDDEVRFSSLESQTAHVVEMAAVSAVSTHVSGAPKAAEKTVLSQVVAEVVVAEGTSSPSKEEMNDEEMPGEMKELVVIQPPAAPHHVEESIPEPVEQPAQVVEPVTEETMEEDSPEPVIETFVEQLDASPEAEEQPNVESTDEVVAEEEVAEEAVFEQTKDEAAEDQTVDIVAPDSEEPITQESSGIAPEECEDGTLDEELIPTNTNHHVEQPTTHDVAASAVPASLNSSSMFGESKFTSPFTSPFAPQPPH